MNDDGIVIAGGGLAAQRCCERLRARGYEGPLRVVCDEGVAPYDRPPLSKEVLAGERDSDALAFKPAQWYGDKGVELLLGERAVSLDPEARRLELSSGAALRYEQLLIATGSRPRRLPAAERFSNAHMLRTAADARALRGAIGEGCRLAIIGAGFIGQEVAATARKLGAQVTIVEAAPTPLVGILGARIGAWFAQLHRAEGVEVLCSAQLADLHGNGRVEQLTLADGRSIDCDALVVGIGVEPAADWVAGSGLEPDGIHTDSAGRTALPGVYAAGDVARPLDQRSGQRVRTEHWEAASRQGQAVALAMLGEDPPLAPLPSFWSDQYGLRIQYVGDARAADDITIDGDQDARDFSVRFCQGDRLVAALLVGRPGELPVLRREIESHYEPMRSAA